MRRNHENTNEVVKNNHSDLQILKAEIKLLHEKLDAISYQVQKATYQQVMNEIDISEFFPIGEAAQLEEFMDRDHPEWPARRREFYNYLYLCVNDNKKVFCKGLLKALFQRHYMRAVKWPKFG